MKKIILALIALMFVTTTFACAGSKKTTVATSSRGSLVTGEFEYAQISVKDFEPVQLVFAEVTGDSQSGAFMTYDALLKEAARVGAHAIINVVIEDVVTCAGTSRFNAACETTRYGSALAIRYTKPLTYGHLVSHDRRVAPPTEASMTNPGFFDSLFNGAGKGSASSHATYTVTE